jgi:hypothetical protein
LALLACGHANDRYGSLEGAPAAGVAPWYKVDFDPDRDLPQPYVLYGDATRFLTEPTVVIFEGKQHLFYEVVDLDPTSGAILGSAIHYAASDDGVAWEVQNDDEPVLSPDQPWEGDTVGGPSVIWRDDRFAMWYGGGAGAGIGLAESVDGVTWEKNDANPVVEPDQDWESGVVASPSVVLRGEEHWLYYSGGLVDGDSFSRRVGRAIGCAKSDDGLKWIKRDAGGRNGVDDAGDVRPVLEASEEWEGDSGFVAEPYVRVDRPVDRDIWRLYYTGNRLDSPVLYDVSIGYAGSFDGVHWDKLQPPYNPVLNEKFPLTIFGVTDYVVVGEFAPCVVRRGNTYRMYFGQTGMFGAEQGLGLAVNPDPDSL